VGDIQQRENPVGLTTIIISYFFLAIANLLFNGLLCLHVLLDNPFGSNPLQFALRSETTHLIKCAARVSLTGVARAPSISPSQGHSRELTWQRADHPGAHATWHVRGRLTVTRQH